MRRSAGLEDAFRPHFFAGVATVVGKLFIQCQPDIALFGEKDYQQLKVVTQLARDLGLKTRIIGVPTVREPDGLALSSRNAYLSPPERAAAPALHRVLAACAKRIAAGEAIAGVLDDGGTAIAQAGFVLDYLEARHAETLAPIASREGRPGPSPRCCAHRQNAADRQRGGLTAGAVTCRRTSLDPHGRVSGELHAVELPVHFLDFADVDVLHDVARLRVDRNRPPRAFPGHALHRSEHDVAIGVSVRLLERLIDQMQAVIGADRDEVGTKADCLFERRRHKPC